MILGNIDIKEKILCFEYVVSLLIAWHQDIASSTTDYLNSFSRLKVLKLLFFVASVEASEKDKGLLDIFGKFVAMPHGPVESDIYNAILQEKTHMYNFPERKMKVLSNDNSYFAQLPSEEKNRIEEAVEALKKRNVNLVDYKPFDLVDISHKWSCWQMTYEMATLTGMKSLYISPDFIQTSEKYFS